MSIWQCLNEDISEDTTFEFKQSVILRRYRQFILTTTARYVFSYKRKSFVKGKAWHQTPPWSTVWPMLCSLIFFQYFLYREQAQRTVTLHRTARLSARAPGETLGLINQQWVGRGGGGDVALTGLSRHIYRLFVKPSRLWHCCADNRITGDVDLKFGSIAHYCNAKPIFC